MKATIYNLKHYLIKRMVKLIGGQEYLTIQMDITNSCNLKCTHCYHANHTNQDAITLDQWFLILTQYEKLLNKLGMKPSFVISGGEPLTSSNFRPLVQKIRNKWPSSAIALLTNGILLNEANIMFIKKNSIRVQVSLDGPTAKTHDEKRGNGNFQKSILGINTALDSDVNVHLLAVLSKKTRPLISDFFKLASSLKVYSMNFTRLVSSGNGQHLINSGEDRPLAGIELRDAYVSIVNGSKIYGMATNTNKPLYCLIDRSLGSSSKFGIQGLVVDYRGNLKVSSRTDYVLGNIEKDGLENLFFKHPLLAKLRRNEIESCKKCEHLSRCGGDRNISYVNNGNFLDIDKGCWKEQVFNT